MLISSVSHLRCMSIVPQNNEGCEGLGFLDSSIQSKGMVGYPGHGHNGRFSYVPVPYESMLYDIDSPNYDDHLLTFFLT